MSLEILFTINAQRAKNDMDQPKYSVKMANRSFSKMVPTTFGYIRVASYSYIKNPKFLRHTQQKHKKMTRNTIANHQTTNNPTQFQILRIARMKNKKTTIATTMLKQRYHKTSKKIVQQQTRHIQNMKDMAHKFARRQDSLSIRKTYSTNSICLASKGNRN